MLKDNILAWDLSSKKTIKLTTAQPSLHQNQNAKLLKIE